VANATNVSFPGTGARTFSTTFTLPSGGTRQAIRGQMRVSGATSPCTAGDFNDRDDLVFAVGGAATNVAPSVSAGADQSIALPAGASLSGTVTDDALPNPPGAVTLTWSKVSGPGTVTFGNASAASTSATFSVAGVYVLRLTASDGALSSSDDVQVTVSNGTSPPSTLKIQYKAGDLNGSDNQIRPQLVLLNTGTSAVTLSQVKIRYWYTRENTTLAQVMACDWAQIGCSSLTSSFTFLNPTRPNANTYLELGFSSGTLAAGAQTGPIQLRLNNSNWSNYTESNDYSYSTGGAPPTNFIDWTRITIYVNGSLVWGTEP